MKISNFGAKLRFAFFSSLCSAIFAKGDEKYVKFSANLLKNSLNSAIGNHFNGKVVSRKVIIKKVDKSSFTGADKICQFNLSKSDLSFFVTCKT